VAMLDLPPGRSTQSSPSRFEALDHFLHFLVRYDILHPGRLGSHEVCVQGSVFLSDIVHPCRLDSPEVCVLGSVFLSDIVHPCRLDNGQSCSICSGICIPVSHGQSDSII